MPYYAFVTDKGKMFSEPVEYTEEEALKLQQEFKNFKYKLKIVNKDSKNYLPIEKLCWKEPNPSAKYYQFTFYTKVKK
jgi:hypothetical protein